jgi:hypothetical protein
MAWHVSEIGPLPGKEPDPERRNKGRDRDISLLSLLSKDDYY